MNRRAIFKSSGSIFALALAGATVARLASAGQTGTQSSRYPVVHTDAEWRALLSSAAYNVLRKAGTEAPFTSPLLNEHRKGIFHCGGCSLPLYSSATKYESGTGWPSFWDHLPNAIVTSDDTSFGMDRTEVHCISCGGHLGHVFPDGPAPTGLRYCMNGVALSFAEATN